MRSLRRPGHKQKKALKKAQKKLSNADLKQAEEARWYGSIVESSDDAIIAKNLEGVIAAWNAGAQRMFGYTEAEAIGQPITIIIPPELFDEEKDLLRRLWAGERIEHYKTRRVSKDGKTIDVSITVSPVRDVEGRIIGASKIARDITESRRAEAVLSENEERYRLAIQAGRMYAFDWDVITDVITRSEESTHIFGLTAEPIKLTKRELLTRVHPEDRATFINSLAECTPESPNTQISYRLLRPDGSVLWLERTGHAFFDEQGRMVRMIGMVADITERKLAEDKLQEYERAVEGLEEMIVVVDREYRYLIANNKFVKMRNMTKEQVVGRFVHEVLTKGVFEAVVKEKLDECFQDKVVRYDMKYTYPELGERDILVSYFPIEGVTGVDRVACIAQDITERKLAEKALSTVSQKLIEAHEEERSRIARELHDDIGQRLALLTGQLAGLKRGSALGSQIEKIHRQCKELASNIQALSYTLHSPKLEYLGLARAAAGLCRELSERHGVKIDFHSENVPKELPREISLSLFRILQEALQNATKHSGSRHFQVSLRGGANEIELTVHDSGIGFETEEAIKGRGLGLTSMQERLKLVRGQLSIESKPQRGTTIQARVPLSPRMKSVGANG
jgi:PAS domain S-box-containing protein